jgi:hypothetical protein
MPLMPHARFCHIPAAIIDIDYFIRQLSLPPPLITFRQPD